MKRFYSIFILCLSLAASAEVITMDLTTATDSMLQPIAYSTSYGTGYYDLTDVWDSTYNDSGRNQMILTNGGCFRLSHLPSQNSYGGQSWEGFTLSQVSKDTANVFGCVANGGLAGVGSPYVIGYYSDWVSETQGYSSNIILFDQEYYIDHVCVCQNSNTMEAITNGGVFNANIFTENDTLALIISALDSNLKETASLTYYLAVDGKKNSGWEEVTLTSLGKAVGLAFRLKTTDMGQFGMNTPAYFALDALTVSTEPITALGDVHVSDSIATKILQYGRLLIMRNGRKYTIGGACFD